MRTAILMESRKLCRVWQMRAVLCLIYPAFRLSKINLILELIQGCSKNVRRQCCNKQKSVVMEYLLELWIWHLCSINCWNCINHPGVVLYSNCANFVSQNFICSSSRYSEICQTHPIQGSAQPYPLIGVESCLLQDCCQVLNGLRLAQTTCSTDDI